MRHLFLIFITLALTLQAAPPPEMGGVPYRTRWEGLKNHPQQKIVKEFSRIENLQNTPPASLPLLKRRMDQDLLGLTGVLQANGYYLAKLEGHIESKTQPVTVVYICHPGPLFKIGEIQIQYVDQSAPRDPWKPILERKDPATAHAIRTEEKGLLRHLQENGYPSPKISKREVVADPENHRVSLHFYVDPGTVMRLGELEILGLESINPKYIQRQRTWEENDLYDIRLIENFEQDLILTGLFSRVKITSNSTGKDQKSLPLTLSVTERFKRTVRFGVSYKSDAGFGANSSWEHRNIFGRGERLRMNLVLAQEEASANLGLLKPGFITNNQSLLFNSSATEDRPEAYTSLSFGSSIGVKRDFTRNFSSSLGLGYKYSSVDQLGEENIYGLLYVPWKISWDNTRNDLNPLQGNRIFSEFTPYTDLLNGDLNFTRLQVSGSYYQQLSRRPQWVLAGKATAGSLLGSDPDNIPADERYYAGGGGSVRGYDYQSIGPKVDGKSVGGDSLLEVSLELRARITETWGFATFLDGGMVTRKQVPSENFPIQWGAGVGLRIFTAIGPLRVDLATPLNADADQTSHFQFYISLGQSF